MNPVDAGLIGSGKSDATTSAAPARRSAVVIESASPWVWPKVRPLQHVSSNTLDPVRSVPSTSAASKILLPKESVILLSRSTSAPPCAQIQMT